MKKLGSILVFIVLSCSLVLFSCSSTNTNVTNNNKNTIMTAASEDTECELVILHTNDTHGHPVKFSFFPMKDTGGIPARATFVLQVRSNHKNILVLDAGDMNTGRPESNFFKAEPDIFGFNYIGYDAMVLGNHEFDNTLDVLAGQMKKATFPFISANIRNRDGTFFTTPYIIKDFKDFKVAVFGITTEEAYKLGSPAVMKNLLFEGEIEAAKKLVPELKKKADIIIALTHIGIYKEKVNKGSIRLAEEVGGIDLIVDGHTHTQLTEPLRVNQTYIVQSWQWGLQMGEGIMKIRGRKMTGFKWSPQPINLTKETKMTDGTKEIAFLAELLADDETISKELKPYVDKVDSILSEKIGVALDVFPAKDLRYREAALGDFVADSMLEFTKNIGVDFALQNGGGIRSDLPKGEITKRTVYEILPFDNAVVVLMLSGRNLASLFDFFATIPQGEGGFPQVSRGVTFTINYSSKKCENILINGKPIDPDREYLIATNSYVASGGDGYTILSGAASSYDTSMFQKDVVIEYVKSFKEPIKPETYKRITLTGL